MKTRFVVLGDTTATTMYLGTLVFEHTASLSGYDVVSIRRKIKGLLRQYDLTDKPDTFIEFVLANATEFTVEYDVDIRVP